MKKWCVDNEKKKEDCRPPAMRAFSYACGHFRSCDKYGSHTIRSDSRTPMLHANFMALCLIEPELSSIEVLLCSCDLDLDPITFIYEPEPYSVDIYRMCKYELPTLRLSNIIVWQTDRHDRNYIPRHLAGDQRWDGTRETKWIRH